MAMLLFFGGMSAQAEQVYHNYTYDYWGTPVESPELYTPERVYYAADMGVSALKQPQDLFVDSGRGDIYIADSENNRVVILDRRYRLVKEIKELTIDPEALGLTEKQKKDAATTSPALAYPSGVFVDKDGLVYIADRDNKRVLVTDTDGRVKRILLQPASNVQFSGVDFLPLKVVADGSGYTYLLCKGVYNGALVYTPDGTFSGYFGANNTEVTVSLLSDLFWRRFATAQQRVKMKKYVPIEFSNLDIDQDGFLYTATLITKTYQEHIKKFNAVGSNVLPHNPYLTGKYDGYYGDLERVYFNSATYESRFTDVCYRNGFIHALDMARGRVFQYDAGGALIGVFGGLGNQTGTFTSPTAIDALDQNILVLDAAKGSVTVLRPTDYCLMVQSAMTAYNRGRYTQSLALWTEISNQNNNCQIAYIGIAKAFYEQGRYTEAMRYFKRGQDRDGYGKAFKHYRNDLLKRIVPAVVCTLLAVWALYKLLKRTLWKKRVRPRREEKDFSRLSWIWYTMRHPVKGFTDCKENRRHSVGFASLTALLLFAGLIVQRQFTGFPFNYNDPLKINILLLFAQSALLLLAWSFSNWAVSTLADGKGRVSEIFYSSAVSLIPFLLSLLLTVVLSNILTADEGAFLTWITGLGVLWSVMLLVVSQMVVQEYSFMRTLVTILLTVALLLVIVFILFLLFSLFQQVAQFFRDIGNEMTFRNLKT